MKYYLPDQKREWSIDRSISFWRGLILGILITLVSCAIACFMYVLPHQKSVLLKEYEVLEARCHKQGEELLILHGMMDSMLGRNKGILLEQWRRKGK